MNTNANSIIVNVSTYRARRAPARASSEHAVEVLADGEWFTLDVGAKGWCAGYLACHGVQPKRRAARVVRLAPYEVVSTVDASDETEGGNAWGFVIAWAVGAACAAVIAAMYF